MKIKVCFLDRDGILIEDTGYPYKWNVNLILHENVIQLRRLIKYGYNFIIVTNQSGIGRGFFSEAQYLSFNRKMRTYLHSVDFPVLKVYHCSHTPEADCACRKPKTGMLEHAFDDYEIHKKSSIMIGDKITDAQCAFNFGIENIYLLGRSEQSTDCYFTTDSMSAICDHITEKVI